MATPVAVKSVRVFNRHDSSDRLSGAYVSLKDSADKQIQKQQLGKTDAIYDIKITFGLLSSTSVVAWNPPSPTGEPLLSDACKAQLKAQFRLNKDIFDASIALVFGNKTTIGQVCSFAKGLKSNTVTNIPGFCCLDAPYQSKIEEWGEKVSSWDARRLVL